MPILTHRVYTNAKAFLEMGAVCAATDVGRRDCHIGDVTVMAGPVGASCLDDEDVDRTGRGTDRGGGGNDELHVTVADKEVTDRATRFQH